ncbi:hypothetical protein, partial [Lactobacillus gallinarum]|uniref:hypothetical protein n=1 Tax=Lactobacillus gallinarum TaxID=52242 RepID=UPI0025A34CF7
YGVNHFAHILKKGGPILLDESSCIHPWCNIFLMLPGIGACISNHPDYSISYSNSNIKKIAKLKTASIAFGRSLAVFN